MRIAPPNNNLQHHALAPLLRRKRLMQRLDISISVLLRVHILFLLPSTFQRHEHRNPELIHLQLLLHALDQVVRVALVPELLLDL